MGGAIDSTNRNVSVTATNASGATTTPDTANATVDNVAPVVTDAKISISGPSGPGGTFVTGDAVTATWNNTAGGDNNSDTISGVTVDFSQFGGGSAVSAGNSAGTWTAVYTIVAGSLNGISNRNVSVTATDNAGNSTTTADTTNATVDNQAEAPGAPTIGLATAGNAQASVAFTAPASDGGAAITGYTVTSNPGGHTGTGASSPITVTGLTNGTAYTFTVTATNSVGTSNFSAASNSVTPKAPNTITFNNPGAQTFDSPPTLTASASSGDPVSFSSETTAVCMVTSGGMLMFFTAGVCTIHADENGSEAFAAATTVVQSFNVNAVAPGAPTVGTATAGNSQATVTFTAPASTGGSAISSYTVISSPGGIAASGPGSPITVTGLTNGVAYTFTVQAENGVGVGAASAASNSVTPKATNTISFANPGTLNFGTAPTLTASATSTDAVTFTSATPGVCTITSGGVLTFVSVGTCTINADEDGSATYLAATQVSQSFAVNAVVPGEPTAVTATAGNGQATVAFTAPVFTGGAAITSYTVTSTPGGLTATGTASPITLTGLTNGVSYTFTVTATNSVGPGAASVASTAIIPAAPSTPSGNPFNPGGTQTQNNLDPGTGVTPTPAPTDIVTNLDQLNNRVGISDNGVVVVLNNGLSEPIKFRNDPPDNVLIAMPSQKPLDLQLNGNTLNIQVDPETPNPPKQTILGTATLLLPDGTKTSGLQLVQGEVVIGNVAPNSMLGGLELSQNETLRGVVAQAGPAGGMAGFRKTADGAGSVSAEQGEIHVIVRLKGAGGSTLRQADPLAVGEFRTTVAPLIVDTITLTLQAGEVARFNTSGELEGVFLGSLSGTAGKTGDVMPLLKPAGVTAYPETTLIFENDDEPARLGMRFSDFMEARLGESTQFSQSADGALRVGWISTEFYLRMVGGIEVVPGTPDGFVVNEDGSLSVTFDGIRSTYQAMLADATDFAAYFARSGFTTAVLDNGLLQVSGGGLSDSFYVARPHEVRLPPVAAAAPGLSAESGKLSLLYTNAAGTSQQLDPAFRDEAQIREAAAAIGWTVVHDGYGAHNLYARSPEGQLFRLVPDFSVELLPQDPGFSGVFRQEGERLYFYYSDELLRQGFRIE